MGEADNEWLELDADSAQCADTWRALPERVKREKRGHALTDTEAYDRVKANVKSMEFHGGAQTSRTEGVWKAGVVPPGEHGRGG